MKKLNRTSFWIFIIVALVVVNCIWMSWNWHSNANPNMIGNKFKCEVIYTNGVKCVEIKEAKTGKLLLVNWEYEDGTVLGEVSYFFNGTNVLNVYAKKNQPARYRFVFHGPEKQQVWWLNEGGARTFTERISYDTNGDRSNFEIWYNNNWYSVDRRNTHNGIVIGGKWRRLEFDTNGMWTIREP